MRPNYCIMDVKLITEGGMYLLGRINSVPVMPKAKGIIHKLHLFSLLTWQDLYVAEPRRQN